MRIDVPDRAEIIRRIREAFPAEIPLCLQLGDCVIEVRMNSDVLKAYLEQYFASFVIPDTEADIRITVHEAGPPRLVFDFHQKAPEPGKSKIKEEYADLPDGRIVRKRLTGMQFVFGGNEHLAVGPCLANPNQVINFINNRYIQWKLHQGGFLAHAAGICVHKRGLALAGFSGMGKSTLALSLLNLGADFISNDRLVVVPANPGLYMHGIAKHPRINPGTALNNPNLKDLIDHEHKARYARLSPEELWNLEEKYDAPVEAFFSGSRFVLGAPMNGLLILNWERGDQRPPVFERIDITRRRDLLRAFRKETGLFYQARHADAPVDRDEDEYADLLSRCQVYEVRGGVDFDRAARFGMEFLKTNGALE